MAEPIIELRNISKSFNEHNLLKDVNLKVYENDSITIIGPGGSGKTVLLKIMALVIQPDSGEILYYGKNISHISKKALQRIRLKAGMLFQNYALFDSMTVRDNIGFYLDTHTNIHHSKVSKIVTENLRRVSLRGIEHLKPDELSGGMKKRVGIARAIAHKPEIVFLDEPTSGLDPVTTDSISKLINNLHDELYFTMINVTNDMDCASKLGNKLAMLYDGKIHIMGDKKKLWKLSDTVLQQFIQGKRKGPIKIYEKQS